MSKKRVPNYGRIIPVALGIIILAVIAVVIIRLQIWNVGKEYIITPEDIANIKLDTSDNITLLPASIIRPEDDDGVPTILIYGNDSYYEGLEDGESISDYIKMNIPKAEVINVCFPGSRMVSYNPHELSPEECPEDYFTLFWLTLSTNFNDFSKQREALKYLDPKKYDVKLYGEILDRFEKVNYKDVDIVLICYDGHDYLDGVPGQTEEGNDIETYNVATALGTVYTSLYGNQQIYPTAQYIIISPTFCLADGEPCTLKDTGNGTISSIFAAEKAVPTFIPISFMDLISGVEITENNYNDYLEKDGITPNKKGRQLIAARIAYLLIDRL